MTTITEIAPDLFRLSIYVPELDLQFNHFLVRDEQPLLFHAGLKGMFADLRQAVATVIDPATLRYIAWSHFESDEIGGLNHWLELAPQAEPVCSSPAWPLGQSGDPRWDRLVCWPGHTAHRGACSAGLTPHSGASRRAPAPALC